MPRFVARQIAEIERDDALRWYGALLALLHVVAFVWWTDQRVIAFLHRDAEPICWPLFQSCERLRVLGTSGLRNLLTLYLGLAVGTAALFLQRGRAGWAWAGLLALDVVKVAFMALDLRLRMNQHYMAFCVTSSFLFVPHKRSVLQVLVRLFYFWAGALKLNWEWISGKALYRPLWLFSGSSVVVACAYVVVLELVIAWGLLARRAWVFWWTLAQLVAFHVMSWPVVHFFYPVLMFLILAIYPLCRLRRPDEPPEGLLVSLVRGRQPASVYATAAAFSILQLVPHAFPGDHAITGEGRLFALHMFDARTVCEGHADIEHADGKVERRDLALGLDVRIACDPFVFYSRARSLCRGRDVRDLDLSLEARRTTDSRMKRVIDVEDFCSRDLRYSPFVHNEWIRTE